MYLLIRICNIRFLFISQSALKTLSSFFKKYGEYSDGKLTGHAHFLNFPKVAGITFLPSARFTALGFIDSDSPRQCQKKLQHAWNCKELLLSVIIILLPQPRIFLSNEAQIIRLGWKPPS